VESLFLVRRRAGTGTPSRCSNATCAARSRLPDRPEDRRIGAPTGLPRRRPGPAGVSRRASWYWSHSRSRYAATRAPGSPLTGVGPAALPRAARCSSRWRNVTSGTCRSAKCRRAACQVAGGTSSGKTYRMFVRSAEQNAAGVLASRPRAQSACPGPTRRVRTMHTGPCRIPRSQCAGSPRVYIRCAILVRTRS
jgi:hypothetical protein